MDDAGLTGAQVDGMMSYQSGDSTPPPGSPAISACG